MWLSESWQPEKSLTTHRETLSWQTPTNQTKPNQAHEGNINHIRELRLPKGFGRRNWGQWAGKHWCLGISRVCSNNMEQGVVLIILSLLCSFLKQERFSNLRSNQPCAVLNEPFFNMPHLFYMKYWEDTVWPKGQGSQGDMQLEGREAKLFYWVNHSLDICGAQCFQQKWTPCSWKVT